MVPWILRMSCCGGDLNRTRPSQNGSASRLYVIGAGYLVWMVSFEWNFICACRLLLNALPRVLTYDSEVMICDVLDPMEVITFLDLLPKTRNQTERPPGIPFPLPPPSPPKPPSGWRASLPNGGRSSREAYLA